ncbi:MAG: hypothetical protein KGI09_07990 [Thaumarchaeota archaeon]|nr:hypothetical protein [Nitrososphaerota archaeon]
MPSYTKPILAENTSGVKIQDIQIQPSTIEIGKTFSISATLINNSTIPIHVKTDDCTGSFSVVFDYHVKVHKDTNYCYLMLTYHILEPGQKFTGVDPPEGTTFIANATGNVNATMTFSYGVPSQSSTVPNNVKTISKSFSFIIYGSNTNNASKIISTHTDVQLPLRQFDSGIAARDVACKGSLQLIIKTVDGSPACVTSRTAGILVERGWGHLP